jgi:nucleoside phosphorylase
MGRALAIASRFNSLDGDQRATLNAVFRSTKDGAIAIRDPVEIGIVTALDHEFIAVCRALELQIDGCKGVRKKYEPAERAPVKFRLYSVGKKDANINVAVTQTLRMGNNSAAIATTSMLYEFPELSDVLLVGIAGGIPSPLVNGVRDRKLVETHVRLGDLFFSEEPVLQYDHVRSDHDGRSNRSVPQSISPRIQRAIQGFRTDELEGVRSLDHVLDKCVKILGADWRRPSPGLDCPLAYSRDKRGRLVQLGQIEHPKAQPRRRKGRPLVHYGKIGSANCLLKDPIERDRLRVEHGIRAIEMEGSGLADAAWNFGVGYAVVRGICDYCDPDKGDQWQKYAAAAAASLSRCIINRLALARVQREQQRSAARLGAK